jgi:hypothetical protein
LNRKAIAKRICPCIPLEHGDNELEISGEDILVDGLIKKGKGENQLEVAIGDGMEFTIHGDLKNKGKKNKLMNNTKVSVAHHPPPIQTLPIESKFNFKSCLVRSFSPGGCFARR